MTPSGVITLLTDFGLSDPYVGVMKGAILGRFPSAKLVDLTHAIGAQDIRAAAFWIERSYRWFPAGTLHLVVVDPGVGTARDPLALEVDGHLFVGPENGVFGAVLDHPGPKRVHRIEPEKLGITQLSSTFHGRDLFGPAAAVLAASADGDLERLGPPREPLPGFGRLQSELGGSIVLRDHFGNLITDVRAELLPSAGPWRVRVRGQLLPVVRTYADAEPRQCVALIGSFGTLELAVRNASAAELLGAGPGDAVVIETG